MLALAAALFMALKFIFHLGNFSNLGLGFWIGPVLVIALVYFALQARNASSVAPPHLATGGAERTARVVRTTAT